MRCFTPSVEFLESRDCPAVLDVTGGVLTFVGDAANDVVTVEEATSGGLGGIAMRERHRWGMRR